MVADTGSTNGTFINGERIAYGRAFIIKNSDILKFGTVEIALEHIVNKEMETADEDFSTSENIRSEENATEDDMKFTKQMIAPDFGDK